MSAIDLLLERNRGAASPLIQTGWPKLCVVTCDDPTLTGQLEQRLGLGACDAVVIRLPAGGGALSIDLVTRAVAKAVYVNGCDEVLVLSHSACTLYALPASKVIDAVAKAGVPRAAIPGDLRELIGAGRDPRDAVRETTVALRRCEYLPDALLVHLGHLDEATGKLELVEHGEQHHAARARPAEATQVAGYTGGPADFSRDLSPAPATPLPAIEGLAASVQLAASTLPELRPFELKPISVELPSVTTVLQQASIAVGPSEQHTSQSLLGDDRPAVSMAPGAAPTQTSLYGDKPKRPPPPPLRAKRPPRERPGQPREVPALRPELVEAMQKVRAFMGVEIGKVERRAVLDEVQDALQNGASSEELVKIALRPVLQAGQSRYKVIDELILLKEDLVRMQPFQAASVIRGFVP